MATSTIARSASSFLPPNLSQTQKTEITELFSFNHVQSSQKPIYTIDDLLRERAQKTPNASLLAYPNSPRGIDDYNHYTARDLDRFADEAARKYIELGIPPKDGDNADEVVAVLAPTSLNYITIIFALSRLGYTLLLLSNRLQVEAYISLLEKTKCRRIVSTSNFDETIKEIQTRYDIESFPVLDKPSYDLPQPSGPRFTRKVNGQDANKRTVFIIHSSGSTGLPKPIFQTQKSALLNYSSGLPYKAFLTLPLYHNHGLSCFFRAIYAGNEIALFNANLPLTANNLVTAMDKLKPGGFHGVPYALKLLGESEKGIELLKGCEVVMFGGSSCPDDLGDRLVAAGVYLVSHYGTTEIGQVMTSFRPRSDQAWNYVRPIEGREKFLEFSECGPNKFELIALDGLPSKVVSNSNDPPNSFHTSDTFTPHPTIPNAWKYIGRLDDRITLVNGEKVLPIHFEHRVRANDYVQECWMFGVGRALPGIMIVPSPRAEGLSPAERFDKIWPSIKEANGIVEGFSQVSKEMVEILPIGTEYPSTDKGTMIRAKTYKRFEAEIDAVYERFEKGPIDGDTQKVALSITDLKTYLLSAFSDKVGVNGLAPDTDFFEAGVDSLQAITIWGLIKREIDIGNGTVGQNVVFEYPSIERLAQHLYSLRTGEQVLERDEISIMKDLIQKYSEFPQHIPGDTKVTGECVLLTGSTGVLGAQVLSQLLQLNNVESIYCLVRADSPQSATKRVLSSLSSKLLIPSNTSKLICLPSDLSRPDLGLNAETFSTLSSKLTKVIHCAWAVNFNLGVSSFESQNIRGAYNLISLCLSVSTPTPASFYFSSSISVAAGTPLPATIRETYIEDLNHAQSMGYARAKLVTEHIVKAAAMKTGMHARVLRVGQIMADSVNGIWNSTEAITLMLRSAVTLGALPELDETPSWFPSDIVAKSILELSGLSDPRTYLGTAPSDDSSIVYHVQNNHLFHWTRDLLPALRASGLSFRNVSQREWVRLLRESNPDPIQNPTIKLLDFFTDKYDNDKPGRSGLVFVTEKTALASPTVKNGFDVVGSGLVDKMLAVWKKEWELEK